MLWFTTTETASGGFKDFRLDLASEFLKSRLANKVIHCKLSYEGTYIYCRDIVVERHASTLYTLCCWDCNHSLNCIFVIVELSLFRIKGWTGIPMVMKCASAVVYLSLQFLLEGTYITEHICIEKPPQQVCGRVGGLEVTWQCKLTGFLLWRESDTNEKHSTQTFIWHTVPCRDVLKIIN